MVFIDLSKAFDSIEHDILLEKISRLGVSPAAYEWFKSYLADRSQYVRIGTTTSTTAPLTHGIPQGSVLSPFLFNIYTDSNNTLIVQTMIYAVTVTIFFYKSRKQII